LDPAEHDRHRLDDPSSWQHSRQRGTYLWHRRR
jgi:hypothetical protein